MPDARQGSAEAARRDDSDLAEVDGLGVAAVVLYGRDGAEPADRAPEPRTFASRPSWIRRWTGWGRQA